MLYGRQRQRDHERRSEMSPALFDARRCRRAARPAASRSTGPGPARRGGAWSRRRPGGSGRTRRAGTPGAMPSPVSRTLTSTLRAVARASATCDAAAARRELDRVGEQVPEDLLQPARVAGDRCRAVRVEHRSQADALGARRPGATVSTRGVDDAGEVQRLHVQPHLAGDDPAHVEQVLDDLRLRAGVALDRVHALRRGRSARPACAAGSATSRGSRSAACAARG